MKHQRFQQHIECARVLRLIHLIGQIPTAYSREKMRHLTGSISTTPGLRYLEEEGSYILATDIPRHIGWNRRGQGHQGRQLCACIAFPDAQCFYISRLRRYLQECVWHRVVPTRTAGPYGIRTWSNVQHTRNRALWEIPAPKYDTIIQHTIFADHVPLFAQYNIILVLAPWGGGDL
ncbi:hypothetical protein BDV10DRAFT_94455 [Aspergillus recurvatus]